MDDLLKVFFWETSECIASSWLAVDRLRQVPDDVDSFEDMLEQFRTMRETSRFLGMSALQAAAGTVLESLESARANRPDAMDRILSLAVDGLKRIEAVVKGMMIADAAMADDSPIARPSIAAGADLVRSKSARRSGTAARALGGASAPSEGESQEPSDQETPHAAATVAAQLAAATQPSADPTSAAARADSATLNQLVSIVEKLAATQEEILRRLAQMDSRQSARTAPAAPVLRPHAPVQREHGSAPETKLQDSAAATSGRLLSFVVGDGSRRAVPLDRVEGVEQLDLDAVDNERGMWITRWNGSPLPLIPVDPDYQLLVGGRSSVILFRIGGQRFGLLIGSAPEISEMDFPRDGGGNPIPVIDPTVYFEQFIRGRFERRRRRQARALQATDAARAAIPADDDLFVRKNNR